MQNQSLRYSANSKLEVPTVFKVAHYDDPTGRECVHLRIKAFDDLGWLVGVCAEYSAIFYEVYIEYTKYTCYSKL